MLDLNRMRYTMFDDKNLLKCNSEFEKALTEYLLLSPEVKLHAHNEKELSLDLVSYEFEQTIKEKRSLAYSLLSFVQVMRKTLYFSLFKIMYIPKP